MPLLPGPLRTCLMLLQRLTMYITAGNSDMRKALQFYALAYASLSTIGLIVWFITASAGHRELPTRVSVVLVGFCLYALAAVVTFQPTGVSKPWLPLVHPTIRVRRAARIVLGTTLLLFIGVFIAFAVASVRKNTSAQEALVPLILISFLLSNSVYFLVHWTVRPENIFSTRFIAVISDPIGQLFLRFLKR